MTEQQTDQENRKANFRKFPPALHELATCVNPIPVEFVCFIFQLLFGTDACQQLFFVPIFFVFRGHLQQTGYTTFELHSR